MPDMSLENQKYLDKYSGKIKYEILRDLKIVYFT